jgi:DNA-binding HxlR family transcriptional regulator
MRSYGQQCALAKALDVIGDRWALLIVRELLIRDGCRYTDLRHGLPGIATNLLADRLRELEAGGVVAREAAPPPVATTLFRLTERGRALETVIAALGRWGAPLVAERSQTGVFRDHWIALPLRLYVRDQRPADRPVRIGLRAGGESLIVATAGDGSVTVESGRAADADASIQGTPHVILRLLTGKTTLADAQSKGLKYEGDPKLIRRFGRAS